MSGADLHTIAQHLGYEHLKRTPPPVSRQRFLRPAHQVTYCGPL
jgi:hypothetical protein